MMTDCKNCKMTDEYCASGDCNKIQENDLACNEISLTERWKKGELPEGEEYWIILTDEWYSRRPVAPVRAFYSCDHEFEGYYDNDIKEVLAPVPSYEEWKASYNCMAENEVLRLKLAKREELLKECRHIMRIEKDFASCHFEKAKLTELLDKIDKVLR